MFGRATWNGGGTACKANFLGHFFKEEEELFNNFSIKRNVKESCEAFEKYANLFSSTTQH